ncbi:MAG: hypothetical protein J6K89_06315 [Oscillospiraceae bacterium]|nr:hypothetical protein [Oscillospiraceae bacterium]
MSELDKKILDNQAKLLKAMDDTAKQRYLDFTAGMLAAKMQSNENE